MQAIVSKLLFSLCLCFLLLGSWQSTSSLLSLLSLYRLKTPTRLFSLERLFVRRKLIRNNPLNGKPVSSLPKRQFKRKMHPHSIAVQSKIKANIPAKKTKMGKRFRFTPLAYLNKDRWSTSEERKNYTKRLHDTLWSKRQTWKSKMQEKLRQKSTPDASLPIHDFTNWVLGSNQNKKDESKINANIEFSHHSKSNLRSHKTLPTIVPAKKTKMGKRFRFKPLAYLNKARSSNSKERKNYTQLLHDTLWSKRQTWKSNMKEKLKPTAHVITTRNEIMFLKPQNLSHYEVVEEKPSPNMYQKSTPEASLPIHDLTNWVWGSNQNKKDSAKISTVDTSTPFFANPEEEHLAERNFVLEA
jgi:hypothetical protein